jgi:RNA polymerase sigma factor (TIGR02999 family)
MSDISKILVSIESGNRQAAAELLPLVYDQLRSLAAAELEHEKPGQSLNATALVHEAYLRLVGNEDVANWDNRRHFFVAAATSIRRILVDRARHRARLKHGGERSRCSIDLDALPNESSDEDFLSLHEALEALTAHDALKAKLVELRFFAGMTLPEAAAALEISPSTADRAWKYTRAWLYARMDK